MSAFTASVSMLDLLKPFGLGDKNPGATTGREVYTDAEGAYPVR